MIESARPTSIPAAAEPEQASRGRVGRLLLWALAGAIYGLLALTLMFVWPGLFGFHTYVGFGSSMGESIPSGSLLVTRSVDADDVRVGDVISFRWEGFPNPITHRVIEIRSRAGEPVFITMGDGNVAPDPFPVFSDQKIGRVIFSAPRVGTLLPVIKALIYSGSLAGGIVLWRRRRRRRLVAADSAESDASAGATGLVPPPL